MSTGVDVEDDDSSVSTFSRQNDTGNTSVVSRLNKKLKSYKLRTESANHSKIIREEEFFQPRLEPTYRLEPKDVFNEMKTKNIIEETLYTYLSGFIYPTDGNAAVTMTKKLSEVILQKVKGLNYERYKIVCFVALGSIDKQSLSIASRCIWDNQFDMSATYTYQKDNFYCNAIVYGLYKA